MSVDEFFKGKHIFVTGGSGFIGKVLIEKLLRSCGGIEKIYVLLRNKKNKTPEERVKIICDCNLFSKLKEINPEAVKKIIPIAGDVIEPKLGLSDEDTQCLIDNVDIIYHAAASVRFDDYLKDSILLNTRGTREVVNLALQAKKLVTFIHVSTTYCQSDKKYVEEKLYPAHIDWRDAIKLAEEVDQHTLNVLSTKIISPLSNTYTFAKSLSEHVVNDLCAGKILAAIVRPSIVLPTINDPVSGWVDNFNGPLGLVTAGGKGILKISYGDMNTGLDCVPVDILVKMLILTTYEKALSMDKAKIPVYNAASGKEILITNRDIIDLGRKLTWDVPWATLVWYPSFSMTNNWYLYYFTFLLYHMVPAVFLDTILKLSGRKPMMIRIQRKVYIANMALIHFMRNTWTFVNNKCVALNKLLLDVEEPKFSFAYCLDRSEEIMYSFYMKAKISVSVCMFNEDFDRVKGFRNTMIFWILNYVLHVVVFAILGWFLYAKVEILNILSRYLNKYLQYLNEL